MSRRLDISSLLCNDDTTPEQAIPAPHLRPPSSSARQQPRSPSPPFSSSSLSGSQRSPPQIILSQRPSSSSYSSSSRNPPTASGLFNGLDALVHAATEERRRLSGGSPSSSPPEHTIRETSRQYLQQAPPLPRSNQSPPIDRYSHSPTQQPGAFQRPSPVLSPIHSILSSPTSVRSPTTSFPQHLLQPQQRLPGRPYLPFERTQSYPSPTLEESHLSHSRTSLPSQAHFVQRQQVEHDHRLLELQRQRQHQERIYREEQTQAARGLESYSSTSPSIPHRPYMPPGSEVASYPRPLSSRASLNDSSQRPDRPPERDRSSIHNLCLPNDPSPLPHIHQSPSHSIPSSTNKRRYSDTHGPAAYRDETEVLPLSREGLTGKHPPPVEPAISSLAPKAVTHHTERKYLGLADMMSPVDERSPSTIKEPPRPEHMFAAQTLSAPPRKRTPPGSSEGRAKALKSMGDFSRSQFAAPADPGPSVVKSNDDFEERMRKRSIERHSHTHEHSSKVDHPHSVQSSVTPSTKSRTPQRMSIPTADIQEIRHQAQDGLVVDLERPPFPGVQRGGPQSVQGAPLPRSRSKHEKAPAPGNDKVHLKQPSSPPVATPKSADKSSLPSRHHSPPKVEKRTSGSGDRIPATHPQNAHERKDDDAHEWFLEQFNDTPANPPPSSSRPPTSKVADGQGRKPPSTKRSLSREKPPRPLIEESIPIDQELEALVSGSPVILKAEAPSDFDMDVDLAVDLLVAETLKDANSKAEDNTMEVDVDNELLSLVEEPSAQEDRSTRPGRASAEEEIEATTTPTPARPVMKAVGIDKQVLDRASMPPPSSMPQLKEIKEKDEKKSERASSQAPPSLPAKKKKEASKTSAKSKSAVGTASAAKSRTKAPAKAKSKPADDTLTVPVAASKPKGSSAAKRVVASRSRSASVKPGESNENKPQQEDEQGEEEPEEDKLYCVCKTKYDEERAMIACDKCDEWYHTQCVKMPDLEVDLVDQFICPICVEKHPDLNLRTTYKPRCLYGLVQDDPDSPDACHKPARGTFSKYCSEECGVNYMQLRLTAWTKKGGKEEKLWESVKSAQRREGVVVCAPDVVVVREDAKGASEPDRGITSARVTRDLARLNELLESVVNLREEIRKGLDVVTWREKLMELAVDRAEQVGQCGWDQRLCFGDAEWADFGSGVLETYEDADKDANPAEGFGAWWCPGKTACDRHSGWQTVRYREINHEKEQKEDALHNLTTRERELRKRIEDLLAPQSHKDSAAKAPLKNSSSKVNGYGKTSANGTAAKRVKKRKAPS